MKRPLTPNELASAQLIAHTALEALAREAIENHGNVPTLALIRERAFALTTRRSWRIASGLNLLDPAARIAHDILTTGRQILSPAESVAVARHRALSELAVSMDDLD